MAAALDQMEIARILPQAYPFLMIDRVVEFKKGESLTAIKNITGNEWVFEGQSHTSHIFPETLLIEAAAQAAILFYRLDKAQQNPQSKIFLGRAKAEFFKPVYVGDQIQLNVMPGKMLEHGGYADVEVYAQDGKRAMVEIIYSISEDQTIR